MDIGFEQVSEARIDERKINQRHYQMGKCDDENGDQKEDIYIGKSRHECGNNLECLSYGCRRSKTGGRSGADKQVIDSKDLRGWALKLVSEQKSDMIKIILEKDHSFSEQFSGYP